MKILYWLIKREYWEHRGGFLWAPAITGCVFLIMTVLTIITGEVLGHHADIFRMDGVTANLDVSGRGDPGTLRHLGTALDLMMCVSAATVLGIAAIVIFFYCLGSLYDDRKDKSLLFWQSLPIPNWKTVASKVASALFVAPAIAAVLGVIAGIAMILVTAGVASFHGLNLWAALASAHPVRLIINIIGLIPLYALCALPTIGWLMLCSAWARSKPFLWAFIIPLATTFAVWWLHLLGTPGLSVQWFFSHVAARMLFAVAPGNWLAFIDPAQASLSGEDVFEHLGLLRNYSALGSGELWLGAAAGAIMLAGAIWLRRWRDDS
jgi:ABC-2 type transport system permease protein